MSASMVASSRAPEDALDALAQQLRDDGSVISDHVRDPSEPPALGLLAAAGPRASGAPGEYALIVESVREGYLLHYGEPRVVRGADDDLALLAGDYLYARGLERLAGLGDLESVRELSDLISLSAQAHAEDAPAAAVGALWLAAIVTIAAGPGGGHEAAKRALGDRREDAAAMLAANAAGAAAQAGLGPRLRSAGEAIGFPLSELPDLG
jgi:hypothetical protein